ncbi:MAG: GNAT family N-acetyltransferase [Candidatus Hodarchaeota archaeon]
MKEPSVLVPSITEQEWQIRYATLDDIEELRVLMQEIILSLRGIVPEKFVIGESNLFQSSLGITLIRGYLLKPKHIFLIAETTDSQLIGLARGQKEHTITKLAFFGTHPDFRGLGVGRTLLSQFLQEAKKLNSIKVFLFTLPELNDALHLYKQYGFIQEGYLHKHFFGEDMLILSLFL